MDKKKNNVLDVRLLWGCRNDCIAIHWKRISGSEWEELCSAKYFETGTKLISN
ncbi:hypothetical protein LQK80_36940 [Bacillus thuringiensis]|nr:hypothetical protein [Bacillus thuringiensis]